MPVDSVVNPEPVIFEATIRPHRSLAAPGRRWLARALIGLCAALGVRFWMLGAWPVTAFCMIEIPIVLGLLHLHHRSGRASERVVLTAGQLRIVRTTPSGRRSQIRLPAAWLNVLLEEENGRVPRLLLGQRQQHLEVGAALGAVEKRALARALRDALFLARNPRFDNPQLI